MKLLTLVAGVFLAVSMQVAAQQGGAASGTEQVPQKDTQAVAIIQQWLTAAGGAAAIDAVQDYTGTGTVNYYWGDGEQGSVTVKGRGVGDFRVDALLPEGKRTWAVSNGTGFTTEADGSSTITPFQNAVNLGSLAFPYSFLCDAITNSGVNVSYVGLETQQGQQVQHVKLETLLEGNDASALPNRLTMRDFYFDAVTYQLTSEQDMLRANDAAGASVVHIVRFSDYQKVGNNLIFPFQISSIVNGQQTETITLNQITFNSGLQDADFLMQ